MKREIVDSKRTSTALLLILVYKVTSSLRCSDYLRTGGFKVQPTFRDDLRNISVGIFQYLAMYT